MSKGDGCIYQQKDANGKAIPNVWIVSISFGRNPVTGKYERVRRVVRGKKADARKVRDQLRREHEGGLCFEGATITFERFSQTWLEHERLAGNLAVTTIAKKERMLAEICRLFGNARLSEINAKVINELLLRLKKERRITNVTVNHYRMIINQVFKHALMLDMVTRNPCEKVRPFKDDRKQRDYLPQAEAVRLAEAVSAELQEAYSEYEAKEANLRVSGHQNKHRDSVRGMLQVSCLIAVRIALATGMRLGEILGLQWGSVDLFGSSIKVSQSLDTLGNIKAPKTKAGYRTVSLDPDTVSMLIEWKHFQEKVIRDLGGIQDESTPVITSNVFGFVDEFNFQHWWKRWKESEGFPDLKFHELRHTHATHLLANGIDVKTVQTRLGHANPSITLGIYAHAIPDKDKEASDLMHSLLKAKEANQLQTA